MIVNRRGNNHLGLLDEPFRGPHLSCQSNASNRDPHGRLSTLDRNLVYKLIGINQRAPILKYITLTNMVSNIELIRLDLIILY